VPTLNDVEKSDPGLTQENNFKKIWAEPLQANFNSGMKHVFLSNVFIL